MEIYVVQTGDTLSAIAEKFGVTEKQLITDNGLQNQDELVIGQCIIIAQPKVTYIVQEGDTLESIAGSNHISIIQLLRNNPSLSDREFIYPGEILVISYGESQNKITTNGYANSFINRNVLKRTLPFLTYLSIYGYSITGETDIVEPDDNDIIQMAKSYHVAPIMLLSSLTIEGVGNNDAIYRMLYNDDISSKYIENMLKILKRKGFYGVNFIYTYLIAESTEVYNEFTKKVAKRLNEEGYILFISIPPILQIEDGRIGFEKIDFSEMGKYANKVIIMNYNWARNPGPPMPPASVFTLQMFLDYLKNYIPPEKMIIGLPLLGYLWKLPFMLGVTRATSLSYDGAIQLAEEKEAEILFDDKSQNPNFSYVEIDDNIPRKYVVWFVDARTMNAFGKLAVQYEAEGIAAWNIMTWLPQLWLIINSQYEIETLLEKLNITCEP